MTQSVQGYIANKTTKASNELKDALLSLPEDKRGWIPLGNARTAYDQVAECALLCGYTADLISTKAWNMGSDFTEYYREKSLLASDEAALMALLHKNTVAITEAIESCPDSDLEIVVQMPWGPMTISEILIYPYWNLSYHLGQITYIASMAGCLK